MIDDMAISSQLQRNAWFGLDGRRRRSRRRQLPCEWDNWRAWSECDVTCGEGTYTRERIKSQRRRDKCSSIDTVREQCLHREGVMCPVHCVWGGWSEWSPATCPVTCGVGKQTSERSIIQESAHGGVDCADKDMVYMERPCGDGICFIDCLYGAWTPWTDCTKSCGSGTFQRARVAEKTAERGGRVCGDHHVTDPCNTHPCPVDCVVQAWSDWGDCTEPCEGGEQTRIKNVSTPQMWGGMVCDPTQENRTCNMQNCTKPKEEEESPTGILGTAQKITSVILSLLGLQ